MTTFGHKIDDEYQWIFMMVNYCCFNTNSNSIKIRAYNYTLMEMSDAKSTY